MAYFCNMDGLWNHSYVVEVYFASEWGCVGEGFIIWLTLWWLCKTKLTQAWFGDKQIFGSWALLWLTYVAEKPNVEVHWRILSRHQSNPIVAKKRIICKDFKKLSCRLHGDINGIVDDLNVAVYVVYTTRLTSVSVLMQSLRLNS